jgi:hypothetical protein
MSAEPDAAEVISAVARGPPSVIEDVGREVAWIARISSAIYRSGL